MKLRRIIAIILVVLGGVLIFLAPETIGVFTPETIGGFILIGIGVVVEAVGIFLEHRR